MSGALDNDTVFLWGNDITTTGNLSSATAEMDAQAERDETPWSSPTGGSGGGGIEESKSFRGEGGGRGCPKDMPVDAILEGVQSEVARILKADATAIPTVRRSCRDVGVWWYNKYLWGLRWSWVSALLQSPFGSLRCQDKSCRVRRCIPKTVLLQIVPPLSRDCKLEFVLGFVILRVSMLPWGILHQKPWVLDVAAKAKPRAVVTRLPIECFMFR